MRVHLVDPRGDVTPYDHALAGALARAGADVELVTSRFLYGPVPREDGYRVSELFYRRAAGVGFKARARVAPQLGGHRAGKLRYPPPPGGAGGVHHPWR